MKIKRRHGSSAVQRLMLRGVHDHSAEAGLNLSEGHYRSLFESARDVIYTLSKDGKITSMNTAFERMTGYCRVDWIGKDFTAFVHPSDLKPAQAALRRSLQGVKSQTFELRIRSKSGDYFVGDFTSTPLVKEDRIVGVLGIMRDITERKKVGEEILRRNRQLKILNSISQSVSTSLNVTEIMEVLAQQLVEQLDLKTAFVMEYVEKEKVAKLLAMYPQHNLFFKALEMLGLSPDQVVVPFKGDENKVYKRLLEGEDWIGKDFSEITTPFLSASRARAVQRMYGVKSIFNVPIMSKGKLMGTIVAGLGRESISDEERNLVISVAAQVAPSIENARLYERQRRKSLQLETVAKLTGEFTAILDVDHLLRETVKLIQQRFDYYTVALGVVNEEGQELHWGTGYIKGRGFLDLGVSLKLGQGITGWVAREGKPMIVNDVARDSHYVPIAELNETKAELSVPIKKEGFVLGVLDVQSDKVGAFTRDDIHMIQPIADNIAVALDNARLFEEAQHKNRRLRRLYELSVTLTGNTQHVFDRIVSVVAELFNVPMAAIEEVANENILVRSICFHGKVLRGGTYPLKGTPCQSVFFERRPRAYANAYVEFPDDSFLREHRILTYFGVPILTREGTPVGALSVMSPEVKTFSDEDRDLLYTFGERIYFELEEERRRKEQAKMHHALRASETKYRSLFENVPDGIFQSSADGKILAANPALVRMLGYRFEEELKDLRIDRELYVNPEDRDLLTQLLNTEGELRNVELRLRRRDGHEVVVLENARRVLDERNKLLYYEGTLTDITELKKAQSALAESEERYRNLVENIHDIYYIADNKGKLVYGSPNLFALSGYAPEQILGQSYVRLIAPEDRRRVTDFYQERTSDGTLDTSCEFRALLRGGDRVWVEQTTRIVRNGEGAVIEYRNIVRDVSERKRAEEALRASEQKLSTLMSNLPGMVFRCANDKDWTMQFASEGSFELTGYRPEELIDNHVVSYNDLIVAEDRGKGQKLIQDAIAKREAYVVEYRIRHESGELKWVWEKGTGVYGQNGELVALEGFITDVTQRKRAEENLIKSEERYRNLVEAARDVIYTLAPDTTISSLNPAFETVTDWSRSDWLGKSFRMFIHPEDIPTAVQMFQSLMRGEKPEPYEVRIRMKSGNYKIAELTPTPLIEGGKVTGILGIGRDVTERKLSEEALRESEQKHRMVMENIDEIIYSIEVDGKTLSASHVRYVSPQVESILGYQPEEFMGSTDLWFNQIHPDDIPSTAQSTARIIRSGRAGTREYRIQHKQSGEYRWMEDKVVPQIDATNRVIGIFGVARDITERKRAENELRYRHQAIEALSVVGKTLASSLDLDYVLLKILDSVTALYGCKSCAVLLYEPTSKSLSIVAQRGHEQSVISGLSIKVEEEGVTGLALLERRPVYIPDVTKEARYIEGGQGVRSELALPLVVAGNVIGVLDVEDEALDAFDEQKIKILTQFADYAAVAIDNARLYRQAQWRAKEFFVINEIMRLSTTGLTFEELAKITAELLAEQFEYHAVSAWLIDVEQAESLKRICLFGPGQDSLSPDYRLPIGRSIVGHAVLSGEPVLVNDVTQDSRYNPWGAVDTLARLSVPVKRGGFVVAVINVDSNRKHAFTSMDLTIISTIAQQLSIAHERAELVEATRASEKQYMELYDNAPEMYQTLDENGVILMCNSTEVDLLGYLKEDLIGKPVTMIVPEELHRPIHEIIKNVLETGKVSGFECKLKKKDGSIIHVLIDARKDEILDRRKVILAMMRDVTEMRLLEEQLNQAQKMESIGTLVSGIAHDFNNILNNILGFSHQLKKHADDSSRVTKYGDTIEKSASRGADLANQLLSFVRQKKREDAPTDVADIIHEVVTLARETFPRNISIETMIEEDLSLVIGNRGELYQALLNLCLNARDAMPTGGHLLIELEAVRSLSRGTGRLIPPILPRAESFLTIRVHDTGCGIPESIRDKIFDPFFTTKERVSGTGLGLSVVYNIIRNHKGTIFVESTVGKGSTFHIYLPTSLSKKQEHEPVVPSFQKIQGDELILLVDDEKPMQELGRELLEEQGYRVLIANDGIEALEIYRRQSDEIDLVILDLVMPKIDGGQTYLELKKINPSMRAFFCSGYTSDELIGSVLEEWHLRALQKPFKPGELLRLVRQVLDEDQ